ncbi:hypothetical protein [Streptomyces tsukubensis]|uniref:hypothetical protein n=1 Tax=Streptomyces tsukubensis TaxID=83656 RepID=UPI003450A3EE
MSTKSKQRGTETERKVVRYLAEFGFHQAERRALRGENDAGDVAGIPGVCIEIKGDRSNKVSAWKLETVREAANAKADFYFLVVRRDYKPVQEWEVHMPVGFLCDDLSHGFNRLEEEPWIRMDLEVAAEVMLDRGFGPWDPSWPITAST